MSDDIAGSDVHEPHFKGITGSDSLDLHMDSIAGFTEQGKLVLSHVIRITEGQLLEVHTHYVV